MNEQELITRWGALEPTGRQRRRIENRVLEWLDAHETSLTTEWLELVKVHPVAGLGYSMGAALSLVAVTPLGWLASALA